MHESGMFQQHILQTFLDKVDMIEYFENPGYVLRVGEVLSKQKQMFEALDITPAA